MSDRPTPETDAACWRSRLQGHGTVDDCDPELCHADFARKLECERDEARDKYNQICSQTLIEFNKAHEKRDNLREAIIAALEENLHLEDGDDCTLAKLKSVVQEWK